MTRRGRKLLLSRHHPDEILLLTARMVTEGLPLSGILATVNTAGVVLGLGLQDGGEGLHLRPDLDPLMVRVRGGHDACPGKETNLTRIRAELSAA